jgi:acyl-CoA reductase-like NAD-dependent aldehyde dehydrogenase
MVGDAHRRGATVVIGGERPKATLIPGGFWCSTTVLMGATPDMPIMREETFGPVVPIALFDTFEQAVGISNKSSLGGDDGVHGLEGYLKKIVYVNDGNGFAMALMPYHATH